MKKFDLEKAKEGHPVQTRDGRDVRLLTFDVKMRDYPVIGLIDSGKREDVGHWTVDGYYTHHTPHQNMDLVMKPQKKSGWINIYKVDHIYATSGVFIDEDSAKAQITNKEKAATIHIEWNE